LLDEVSIQVDPYDRWEARQMRKLAEIRSQEMMYRERALLDADRRDFWLAKADEWAQLAVDEIALQFGKRGATRFTDDQTHKGNGDSSRARLASAPLFKRIAWQANSHKVGR
jgi:hypothetical protein